MTTTSQGTYPSAQPISTAYSGGKPVVVGVDESPGSLRAVDWAIAEATARHVGIHLIHCWTWQRTAPWTSGFDHMVISDLKRAGEAIIAKARAHVIEHGDVPVTSELIEGIASDVLTRVSTDAALVVLGSRHRHSVDRAVLGSVSNALVARANCPVVVLGAPAAVPGTTARVVVGVSGTDHDEQVLAFAFDEAQRRGAGVKVIHCWHPPLADEKLPPPEQAHLHLAEALAGWRERHPDVDVQSTVVRAHPADALIGASASQELLVVGRHAQRVRLGHLMGSVSLAVLHHATCPVAIVPPTKP